MGGGFVIRCTECQEEDTYLLGVGMMHFEPERIADCLSKANARRLLDLIRNHSGEITEFGYKLYTCPICDTLHNRYHIKVSYDDDNIFEPSFRCGQCRNKLKPSNKTRIKSANCKRCGKTALVEDGEILWD